MRRKQYNYADAEIDIHYENSGATGEENEHTENCEWIYGNCTCGQAEKMEENFDWEDDGDW